MTVAIIGTLKSCPGKPHSPAFVDSTDSTVGEQWSLWRSCSLNHLPTTLWAHEGSWGEQKSGL
jgi:hypothetical protein